jgi:hypothetical protein
MLANICAETMANVLQGLQTCLTNLRAGVCPPDSSVFWQVADGIFWFAIPSNFKVQHFHVR